MNLSSLYHNKTMKIKAPPFSSDLDEPLNVFTTPPTLLGEYLWAAFSPALVGRRNGGVLRRFVECLRCKEPNEGNAMFFFSIFSADKVERFRQLCYL